MEDDRGATSPLTGSGESGHLTLGRLRFQVVEGPDAGLTFVSSGPRTVLGTDPSADVRLTDGTVSRFHCEVTLGGGTRPTVRDLGSTNETRIEGITVQEAKLGPGNLLVLGRTHLRVEPVSDSITLRLSERESFGKMVGRSVAARRAFALLEQAAPSDATVLLMGETGTGKEVAAESIHLGSARASGPFVVVDCGAIPPTLLESELFGHERGAFTGADRMREGAFEAANGGTIFLDEIGELGLELQPKLLRVLEKRQVKRIGSNAPIALDVRVVGATNRDLRSEVNAKRFRADLYFRLAVLTIALPPLRERQDDLPLLIASILDTLGAADRPEAAITRTAHFLSAVRRHKWPGNVRELRNYVERCLALQEDAQLDPAMIAAVPGLEIDPEVPLATARERFLASFERAYLEATLRAHDGNVSAAARAAGVDRTHFHRLLRKCGVRGGGA